MGWNEAEDVDLSWVGLGEKREETTRQAGLICEKAHGAVSKMNFGVGNTEYAIPYLKTPK